MFPDEYGTIILSGKLAYFVSFFLRIGFLCSLLLIVRISSFPLALSLMNLAVFFLFPLPLSREYGTQKPFRNTK